MDFIERVFGISPDGGSGSFEMMLLFVPVAAIVAYVLYRRNKRTGLCPRPNGFNSLSSGQFSEAVLPKTSGRRR